jgi:hypothetical protein
MRLHNSRMKDKNQNYHIDPEDLVNLVTVPVLHQLNKGSAEILKMLRELQESVEMIAREIARQIEK